MSKLVYKIKRNDEYLVAFKNEIKFVKISSGRGYHWSKDTRPLEIMKEYNLEDCELVQVELSEKEQRYVSGSKSSDEIGTTRQYENSTLRSALGKLYKGLKKMNPEMTPFEIVNALRNYYGVISTEDVEMFFNSFPKNIREEIKASV